MVSLWSLAFNLFVAQSQPSVKQRQNTCLQTEVQVQEQTQKQKFAHAFRIQMTGSLLLCVCAVESVENAFYAARVNNDEVVLTLGFLILFLHGAVVCLLLPFYLVCRLWW